jgi:hypothetical protein
MPIAHILLKHTTILAGNTSPYYNVKEVERCLSILCAKL